MTEAYTERTWEQDGKRYRFRVVHDEAAGSPLGWDNLGKIATWHGRYNLGDEQPTEDPKEFKAGLPEGTVILPVYLMDHSGLTLRTEPFGCQWDSGQVGFIYSTPEMVKAMGTPENLIEQCLRDEVSTYSQYVEGDCWGFQLEKADKCEECGNEEWEHVDSCWGFYGSDFEKNGMAEHLSAEQLAAIKAAPEG